MCNTTTLVLNQVLNTTLNTEDKLFLTIAGFITALILVVLLMEMISIIMKRVKNKFKHRKINKRNR